MYAYRLALLLTIFFALSQIAAASPGDYADRFVGKALDERAYEEREWQVLMHYKGNAFVKKRSLVDDPAFFLSPSGKTDPAAEMEATIRGFFSEPDSQNDNGHPLCRFPARRKWLSSRLGIKDSMLPETACEALEKTRSEIDPKSVTLVFPFLYITRPMSMFGHTLLRINGPKKEPLLGYGVTFNAVMPDDANAIVYSFKGVFGGYPGVFTVKKYYQTIFEYTNIDRRDIWEYDLNFTEEETENLFLHLWEMADIYSDYYFLDENCSYNLLFLMEAARPSLNLTTSLVFEAPSETVKKAYELGIVKKPVYRPSHSEIIETIAEGLPYSAVKKAVSAGKGKASIKQIDESDYSEEMKVRMIDLAVEILRYDNVASGHDEKKAAEYRTKTIEFLTARSRYRFKPDYDKEIPAPPHEGHDIARITVGAGVENGKFYTEAGFRAAFHSLDDIDDGYITNSETAALNAVVRWNTADESVKLQKLDLFSLAAYPPVSRLFVPLSWKIKAGGVNKSFKNDGERFVPYIRGGVGLAAKAWKNFSARLTADADFSFSGGYSSYFAPGLGATAAVTLNGAAGKLTAEVYYRNCPLSGWGSETGVSAKYAMPVTSNNSLLFSFERSQSWGTYKWDAAAAWRFYF